MPQIGWRDPATGKTESFEYWLAEAEAYGSALDMPFEVLAGLHSQMDRSGRPDGISATMLLGCPRKAYFDKHIDYYAEPLENWASFRGTLAHSIIEKYAPKDAMVEKRYWRMFKGVAVSGQIDSWRIIGAPVELTLEWDAWLEDMYAWEQGGSVGDQPVQPVLPKGARFLVRDWKTKHDLPNFTYLASGHQKQGNLYIWLLRIPKDEVDTEFIYITMQGVKIMKLFNGGTYRNGRAKPEQYWTQRQTTAFLDDRLLSLAASMKLDRPIPYDKVDDDDLWNCNYCPAKQDCYKRAATEQFEAWQKGGSTERVTPRDRLPK